MSSGFIFDQADYVALTEAREATIRELLSSLQNLIRLQTAVDVGCGLGHFSSFLANLGFRVLALDGRVDNVNEARRRYPAIEFQVADAESKVICSHGTFDLVLCLGLLYHLENPFAAVRNLFAMTEKIAIIEGMCCPGEEAMLAVRDEGPTEDQGLQHVALYPTENALIKLLYRSGFPHVFRFRRQPNHPDYVETSLHKKVRTILVAATFPLSSELLLPATEPITDPYPWIKRHSPLALVLRGGETLKRVGRFALKPWHEKARSFFFRWVRIFPGVPVPVRLPFGGWWLARNDFLGAAIFDSGFENVERSFVERFLRPGMAVLDIGAHHGYYTLLASRIVGPRGRVLAVEASPRERERLQQHLRINRCKNVRIESRALGESAGMAELHLVRGWETGCNSLRRPDVSQPTETISVRLERLDRVLQEQNVAKVDFIKLDVEGAELSVLKGASRLLSQLPRPVILAEVQDIRTRPWGYPAREIVRHLAAANYRWFVPLSGGGLRRMDTDQKEYEGNFVAVPEEQVADLSHMITDFQEEGPSAESNSMKTRQAIAT